MTYFFLGATMTTNVCVTGASGFIGAYVVRELLEHGYHVNGTVRSVKNPTQYAYLTALNSANERLELIEGDLMAEGSFDKAVQGCDHVIHVASPYVLDVKNAQTDLVDPAVNGTLNVLRACQKAGTVKRVVLTSSGAAITDSPEPGKVYTEKDWNEKSSLTRNPYYYSKTVAERAAWNFIKENELSFELVVINPIIVIGPSLSPSLNTSNSIIQAILTGVYPAILNIGWAFVDVRDVAKAHRLAMENQQANGRYLCANQTWTMRQVVELLRHEGYTYKLPKMSLESGFGSFLVKLMSYMQSPGVGTYLRTQLEREYQFDNSKIIQDLGMEFMPVEQSILETTVDVIQWGHVPAESA
jgi:dihydroflavonol-4-reductase